MYHSTSRPCFPNSSGPAHCGDAMARCWGIVQDNLKNGKPQLNGSPTCQCQFTDWSYKNASNHVPGYTGSNSPIPNATQYMGAPRVPASVPGVKRADGVSQWYNDSSASSPATKHTVGTRELSDQGNGSYRFSSNPDAV